jgi:hypothetical protein
VANSSRLCSAKGAASAGAVAASVLELLDGLGQEAIDSQYDESWVLDPHELGRESKNRRSVDNTHLRWLDTCDVTTGTCNRAGQITANDLDASIPVTTQTQLCLHLGPSGN